jgi:DNA primase
MARYGLRVDPANTKITCPFKHHQNGNERTASFYFYPNTNSFWCFGCKTGSTAVDFVAAYDNVSRSKAANKIIRLLEDEVSDDWEIVACNSKEKEIEIIAFSNAIRASLVSHPDEQTYIETITEAFDNLTEKHELNIEGLKMLSSRLIERLPK